MFTFFKKFANNAIKPYAANVAWPDDNMSDVAVLSFRHHPKAFFFVRIVRSDLYIAVLEGNLPSFHVYWVTLYSRFRTKTSQIPL